MIKSLVLIIGGGLWAVIGMTALLMDGALLEAAQSLSLGLLLVLASDQYGHETADLFPN